MFCLHSLHGRVGVCLGLEVVVGVRRLCISVWVGVVSVVVGSIWSVCMVLNSAFFFRADVVVGQEVGVDVRCLCTPAVGRVGAVTGREVVAGVSVLCLLGSCWCLR